MNTTISNNSIKHLDHVSAFADKALFVVKMTIAISAIILVEVSAWV